MNKQTRPWSINPHMRFVYCYCIVRLWLLQPRPCQRPFSFVIYYLSTFKKIIYPFTLFVHWLFLYVFLSFIEDSYLTSIVYFLSWMHRCRFYLHLSQFLLSSTQLNHVPTSHTHSSTSSQTLIQSTTFTFSNSVKWYQQKTIVMNSTFLNQNQENRFIELRWL